jgi:glutamate-1-semialdehyde aminotransferase
VSANQRPPRTGGSVSDGRTAGQAEPDSPDEHRGYHRGAALASSLVEIDARPHTYGEIVPSTGHPYDNFPAFVARAEGAHVWDVDDNRYVDFLLGYGPVILGHNHPEVQRAVRAALDEAVCQAPFWSPTQLALVERLVEVIPGAEMAYLLRTGSDATSCAVRIARISTGRSQIIRAGYNGWHDWSSPRSAGIPAEVRALTTVVPVGDLAAMKAAVAAAGSDLAAIVTMPYEHEAPDPDHLRAVGRLAASAGAVFVLDEVRSGFRIALGGAQEAMGVRADLACFSKAMANGYSISAVTGSANLLRRLAETKVSSTFFANRAEQAAALATIGELDRTRPFARINALGTTLAIELNAIFAAASVPLEIVGHPASPHLRSSDELDPAFLHRLAEGCARHGAIIHPTHQWFLSAAHTETDVEVLVEAVARSIPALRWP